VANQPTTSRQPKAMPLNDLSEHLQLSKQTIVRWIDRHLIDADLYWTLSESNQEIRMIDLTDETLEFLEDFAADYRDDVVSRTEARRILKQIDRKKIKKLIRAGDVKDVEVDEETRVVVGSIEDYLMERERVEESDEEDDE
jgi:DNA-binding MarR family transcriptional regulator